MNGSGPDRARMGKTAYTIAGIALLGVWLVVVLFTLTRHEFWRDEVRALSLARAAHSPVDVFLIRNEGHPVLWHLLLYLAKSIVDTPLVLPVLSVAIALAAVSVFMFRSPFPLWLKALFLFGELPLYEYSVMARNYGISMLLFFVAAALYRERDKHGLRLAIVLALLANTNVHSAMFVCLITAQWIWDTVVRKKAGIIQAPGKSFYLALAIVVAGLALCAAVAVPGRDTIVTKVYSARQDWLKLTMAATLHPEKSFWGIGPAWLPPFGITLLLYLAVLCLLRRFNLFLAALAGLISLGVFFRAVYLGFPQHQGLFLIFLLFLYWIAIESSDETSQLQTRFQRFKGLGFKLGLYGVLPILLLGNIFRDNIIYWDIKREMSSSKAFGAFLNQSEAYRNAIIVGEPPTFMEALPYYATNAIYFPRELRFGTTVSFSSKAVADLSLGQLLSVARDLKARSGQPVLIVLGNWPPAERKKGSKRSSYGKWKFTWTPQELDEAAETLVPVVGFHTAITDENYEVMALK
jgi:hypothetical protein